MALAVLVRVAVVAVALWVATLVVPGIGVTATTPATRIGTLVGVALIFGVVNAVVKPVVSHFSRCTAEPCVNWDVSTRPPPRFFWM